MIDVIEDVDPKIRATTQDVKNLVQGLWREVLEAYMLGRELLESLPQGVIVKVVTISMQKIVRQVLHLVIAPLRGQGS